MTSKGIVPGTLFAVWLAGLAGGCSKRPPSDLPEVFPVHGTLTYHGKPMSGAIVTFLPVGAPIGIHGVPRGKIGVGTVRPTAVADDQGNYALTSFDAADGAQVGEYFVTIYWPAHPLNEDDLDAPWPPDRLQGAYNNPARSKLRVTVQPEDNTIDFDLPQ